MCLACPSIRGDRPFILGTFRRNRRLAPYIRKRIETNVQYRIPGVPSDKPSLNLGREIAMKDDVDRPSAKTRLGRAVQTTSEGAVALTPVAHREQHRRTN